MHVFLFFLFPLTLFGASVEQRLLGWVSDAACGPLHTKPGGEDCVRKCIRGGEHINPKWKAQKMTLVSDDGKDIFVVANPVALTGLEGKHVLVMGTIQAGLFSVKSATIVEEAKK